MFPVIITVGILIISFWVTKARGGSTAKAWGVVLLLCLFVMFKACVLGL